MPDEPLGVGLVGYGLAGRTFHAPFIDHDPGLALRAVVTSDAARAAQAATEHPGVGVAGRFDELLARDDIDLVVIATPNRTHAPLALQAIATGRHVLVDKPIAIDEADGDRMIEAAERAGVVLSVYQNRRWDGDFLTIRRLHNEGALGAIDSLETRFEYLGAVDAGWREEPAEAGGPLYDLGAHLVDQALLLFGPVRRLWAQAHERRPGTRTADSWFLALEHASGVATQVWMSKTAARPGPRFRLRGSLGEYVKEQRDPQEGQLLAGLAPDAPSFGVDPPEEWGWIDADGSQRAVPTERGSYATFYRQLCEAVRGRGPAPADPAASLEVLRVLRAAASVDGAGEARLEEA